MLSNTTRLNSIRSMCAVCACVCVWTRAFYTWPRQKYQINMNWRQVNEQNVHLSIAFWAQTKSKYRCGTLGFLLRKSHSLFCSFRFEQKADDIGWAEHIEFNGWCSPNWFWCHGLGAGTYQRTNMQMKIVCHRRVSTSWLIFNSRSSRRTIDCLSFMMRVYALQ